MKLSVNGINAKNAFFFFFWRKRKVEGSGKRKGERDRRGNWKWSFGRNGKNRKLPLPFPLPLPSYRPFICAKNFHVSLCQIWDFRDIIFKQDCRKSKAILVGLRSCRWEVWGITSRKGRENNKKKNEKRRRRRSRKIFKWLPNSCKFLLQIQTQSFLQYICFVYSFSPFFCVHIDYFPSAWPNYPLLMIHFSLYYLFLCFFSRSSISFSVDLSCVYCWSFFAVFFFFQ